MTDILVATAHRFDLDYLERRIEEGVAKEIANEKKQIEEEIKQQIAKEEIQRQKEETELRQQIETLDQQILEEVAREEAALTNLDKNRRARTEKLQAIVVKKYNNGPFDRLNAYHREEAEERLAISTLKIFYKNDVNLLKDELNLGVLTVNQVIKYKNDLIPLIHISILKKSKLLVSELVKSGASLSILGDVENYGIKTPYELARAVDDKSVIDLIKTKLVKNNWKIIRLLWIAHEQTDSMFLQIPKEIIGKIRDWIIC